MDKTITTTTHEYGYVIEDKIFLKGFLDYPDRQIGHVRESVEASLEYFEKRFEIAQEKVKNLEKLIEDAQNKGSYLMKLIHMRKYLAKFDGLGDYVALFQKLDDLEENLKELIAQNRVKNLEIKQALLQELKGILENIEDWQVCTDQIQELKLKWIKTGAVDDEHQEKIEEDFNETIKDFFEKRKEFFRIKTQELKDRQNLYQDIIDEAYAHQYADDFEETFLKFREWQTRWKTIGKVPHKKATKLWQRFKEINDVFFGRYKTYKGLKEKFPESNAIEIRDSLQKEILEISDKLRDLDIQESTANAKSLLMRWKTLTEVFRHLDRDLSAQFRFNCDRVFELSYLLRVVKRKYPLFDTKLQEEKLRIKTSFMRELIKKDESEYENKTYELENSRMKKYQYRTMQNTLRVQKRKIDVKKEILKELETSLKEF